MHEERDPSPSDEQFLDALYEQLVGLIEEGGSVSIDALLGGREHLRFEAVALLQTARDVASPRPITLPRVPGFELERELGRGGMGGVYLARQIALGGRAVALKVLPAAAVRSAVERRRFLTEARAIARLRHPHVVAVYDVVVGEALCAYAMEWIDGASLADVVRELCLRTNYGRTEPTATELDAVLRPAVRSSGESYPTRICRIGIAIARALGALHAAGLVHRDVKPSNVLLRRDGTALLSDFGLVHESDAELTHAGQFVGTPAYASPEQLVGGSGSLDARSDVYSLGVTLYHALALHLPFDAPDAVSRRAVTPAEMLQRIAAGRARPLRDWNPRLSRDLDTILAKATELEPALRYASADEFADDLQRLVDLQPIQALRAGPLARAAKLLRRRRAAVLGGAVGAAMALALASVAVVRLFLAPRWADDHARAARLALLDARHANAIFSSELFGAGPATTLLEEECLRRALDEYDAALRWSAAEAALRAERDVVASAAAGESTPPPAGDSRAQGLFSYLRGDIDGALAAWSEWEARRGVSGEADSLLTALLGVLHLVRNEPARAYPRLREACREFPETGFLWTYLADAALQSGDVEIASRLLDSAARMPNRDPLGALERMRADLAAASGHDQEAEALYRALPVESPAGLHLARFLVERGRTDEALDVYVRVLHRLKGEAVRREFRRALAVWWSGLTLAERRAHLAASVWEAPWDPHAFVARLRVAAHVPREGAPAPAIAPVGSGDGQGLGAVFATLSSWTSSPPLEHLGSSELAALMEVENMTLWNEISRAPATVKPLFLLAWRSPWPIEMARALADLAQRARDPRRIGRTAVALGATSATLFSQSTTLSFEATGPGGDVAYGSHENCVACGVVTAPLQRDGFTLDVLPSSGLPANGMHLHEADSIDGGVSGIGSKIPDRPGGSRGVLLRDGGQGQAGLDPVVIVRATPSELFRLDALVVGASLADGSGTTHVRVTAQLGGATLASEDLPATSSYDAYSGASLGALAGLAVDRLEFVGLSPTGKSYFMLDDVVLTALPPNPPTFTGLGDLAGGSVHSAATAISADGTTVVGESSSILGSEAFRWSFAAGMSGLGDLPGAGFASTAYDVSADGSVVAGDSDSGNSNWPGGSAEAFRWSASSGMLGLGDLPGGYFSSSARAVDAGGQLVGGFSFDTTSYGPPCWWSAASGWTPVPDPGGVLRHGCVMDFASAPAPNATPVMVGFDHDTTGQHVALRFDPSVGTTTVLGDLPGGGTDGIARAVSADGSVVVGSGESLSGPEAFCWTGATGLVALGDLPGGAFASSANEIAPDGSWIVGFGTGAAGQRAVVWDGQREIHLLEDVLAAAGVNVPAGWILLECAGIAVDGSVVSVCGHGQNPAGNVEAYVARFVRTWPAAASYCTAGTSTNGCTPLISATGSAILSQSSGFVLTASGVEGQKSGLVFYGISGRTAAVWGNGSSSFLCVKSPSQRMANRSSGGTTGQCDGTLSEDWLAWTSAHPAALGQPFSAGALIQAQAWYRDPSAVKTTNLSNGIEFTLVP